METNDWIMRAFEDATENSPFDDPFEEAEYQAYMKHIVVPNRALLQHCGTIVGLDKMDRLSKVILKSKEIKTFAEFVKALCTISFSIGYRAGEEAKL